ncbi:uncharacterized protein LOC126248190 [Schistocerca nitens]|uniref:uncharacterized protein LOC126248190 n=1 Tax=Schistocerca nitens TaxID=7011 RepID=UPI0021186CC7|nr:uncharacterized protein LOC126248190 [Schistocerca nitens]
MSFSLARPPGLDPQSFDVAYLHLATTRRGLLQPRFVAKTARLLEVIEARRAGDEARVEQLLSEYREQRRLSLAGGSAAGRPATSGAPGTIKRRRVQGAARMRDFFYPQLTSTSRTDGTGESCSRQSGQDCSWSPGSHAHAGLHTHDSSPEVQHQYQQGQQQKLQQQLQPQPQQEQQQLQQDQAFLEDDGINNSKPQIADISQDTEHETKHSIMQQNIWFPQPVETKMSPDSGFMSPSPFSSDEESANHYWNATIMSPALLGPVYSQARMQSSIVHQPLPPSTQMPPEERTYMRPLEMLWNLHNDMQTAGASALTFSSYCYRRPISSVVVSPDSDRKPLSQPSLHFPIANQPPQSQCYVSTGGSHKFVESPPNFRQNNQISYPLIYNYLASTEEQNWRNLALNMKDRNNLLQKAKLYQNHLHQLNQQYQSYHSQQNLHVQLPVADASTPPPPPPSLPPLTAPGEQQWNVQGNEKVGQWTPPDTTSAPLEQDIPQLMGDLTLALMNTVPSELPTTSNDTITPPAEKLSASQPSCIPAVATCTTQAVEGTKGKNRGRTAPLSVASGAEDARSTFQEDSLHCVSCPQQECNWTGRLRSLASHLRQRHVEAIMSATETSHTVTVAELQAQQHVYFLQEAGRRLFIVAAHFHGVIMYITVQSIPSGRAGVARGALEVVASDGKPRSWRGRIRGYHEPLSLLWARKHCLTVDPAALGSSSSITLYCSISLHAPMVLPVTHKNVEQEEDDTFAQQQNLNKKQQETAKERK